MRQLRITKQITNRDEVSLTKYFHEIGKIELLSDTREVELGRRIKNDDPYALHELVISNLLFVVSVAKQYQNQGLNLSDMISEGNLGLIRAAQRFDETKGFKFISYAVWWIRQAILQALAEHARIVRIPLSKSISIKKIHKTFIRLEQEYNRTPTTDEVAFELGISPKTVNESIQITGMQVSMDAPISQDEESTMYDLIPGSDSSIPDRNLLEISLATDIENALSALSSRESCIVELYYGLNGYSSHTLDEISEKLMLTRERVRQIKKKAIIQLREKSLCEVLKAYLD